MIRMVGPDMAHLHESDMYRVTLQEALMMNQLLKVVVNLGR